MTSFRQGHGFFSSEEEVGVTSTSAHDVIKLLQSLYEKLSRIASVKTGEPAYSNALSTIDTCIDEVKGTMGLKVDSPKNTEYSEADFQQDSVDPSGTGMSPH